MTKPTGRPRGRPKTKEYVTLMARVPQDLADQVQGYAGRKRQTISDVLRDGLLVLLQDDEPYGRFTSDMNTAEDIMSDTKGEEEEEGQPDAQPAIVSDMKEALPYNVYDINKEIEQVADATEEQSDILSDTKEAVPVIMSDAKKARQRAKRGNMSDMNKEKKKAPDVKEDQPDISSDVKEDKAAITSDTKRARAKKKQAKRPAKQAKRS